MPRAEYRFPGTSPAMAARCLLDGGSGPLIVQE